MRRPRPLRATLLTSQAVAIVLLAAGVLAVTLWGAGRAVQAVSRELVDRAAAEIAAQLDDLYRPAVGMLDALAALVAEGTIPASVDAGSLQRLAAPWIGTRTAIGAVGIFGEDGHGLALRRVASGWEAFGVAPDGRFDARRERWWLPSDDAPAGPARWSERTGGGLTGREGLSVSRRVIAADGSSRLLVVEIQLDDLLRRLEEMTITPGSLLGVLDDRRRLLAWAGPEAPPAGYFLRAPRDLGLPLFDDARRARDAAGAGAEREALRFTSGGAAWWARLRHFAVPGGGEQIVAVLVPADDLLDQRAELLASVLGMTALALGLALVGARRTARRVAEPLEVVVARSRRIAEGDLEPEPPVPTDIVEVEHLAEAQESMRAGLKTLLKLERDLQIARQIQQATWPRELPAIAGLKLAASTQPADETGGDGYDLVAIPGEPPGRTFLFLADATGHGIGPALSVTQLRAMLRMGVRSGHDLADLVTPVHEQLKTDLPGNRFITAWLGVLDADGRTLESLSAGQAPLLHYHAAEDRLEVLKADLPPLGLLPRMPSARPRHVALAPGDLWVVLSDGYYEAESPAGEELGVARIGELVRRCRARPAAELLAELGALVDAFTAGAPATDDRTALVLRRLA